MKRHHLIILSTIFSLLFGSCEKDDKDWLDPNLPSRTVVVYLGGDNSLSSTIKQEVEALRSGWTYTGNHCVIYIDPADDVPCLLSLNGGDSKHPEPYIDTLEVYSEENSSSAKVFKRVIDEAVRLYPADSYGLIYSSHSSGWLPEGTLSKPLRSIGSDSHLGESTEKNSEMEIADFADAIDDHQFDFIVFESCLMAGVEVAYELRNKAYYILASSAELLVPGFVPVYKSSLHYLFETKYSVEQSLTTFATVYYNSVYEKSGAYQSTTLSVLKTEELDALSSKAKEIYSQSNFTFDTALIWSLQHFDRPGSYGDSPISPRYFDFLECMEKYCNSSQYAEIERIMEKIVVWKAATPTFMTGYNGFEVNKHSGMTVYIKQGCFEKLNAAYEQTSWFLATHD